VENTGARGGDLIVTEPWTGEILALASLRDGETGLAGINTPYEPGSTLKPFTVATLLREGRAELADSVDTGMGSWVINRRTIQDVAPVGGMLTLARALQVSSNVGIAKFAQSLDPNEQFEGLRDFGFGVPTGIALPGEASGVLRRPSSWSSQSAASLAIGYEINVTPIQMAMAYGAIANGGVLMEPRLVLEIRDESGRVIQRFDPEPVRRVLSEEIAEEITATLVGAVETGTGTQARLASFAVAGKSGTARAYGAGGYEEGAYVASFVGFFPAEQPQLVIYVKLERPQGAYYGGATAAPVTRATMEAILAARRPPLDREALAAIAAAQRLPRSSVPVVAAALAEPVEVAPSPPPVVNGRISVPDVRELSPRAAARRLHSMGLSVIWESAGTVTGTVPSPGTLVLLGDTIRLLPVVAPGPPKVARGADD
ncbi:MAG: penicillin-binding transpeptidase domain-containing protein, partial [Gemmatimonadota bacterium]